MPLDVVNPNQTVHRELCKYYLPRMTRQTFLVWSDKQASSYSFYNVPLFVEWEVYAVTH